MQRPRRQTAWLIATAVAATAIADTAHAQFGQEITERQKQGVWRVGPFHLTPKLELRNAGVDTNVFLSQTDQTQDTSVVFRAGLDAYLPVRGRLRILGTGWLDFNYFADQADQSSTDPGGQGRAELDVSRFTFVAGGGGFTSRQLVTTDIDERVERREDWVHGMVQTKISRLIGIDVGVESHRFRYYPKSDEAQRYKFLLDRDNVTWAGRFRYKVTPLTTFLVSAERIDDTFVYALPGQNQTLSYRYLGGFEFGEKAVITGRFLGGVRNIPADSAGSVEPYTGPAFQSFISAPFFKSRARLTFGYDRDVFYSADASLLAQGDPRRNTYKYGRLGLTLDFDLPLSFVGRAIARYENADYLLPFLVDGVETPRQDKVQSFGGSLLRRIGRNMRLGVTALHTKRDSSIPGYDYSRWQYGLQGEFTP